MSQTLDYSIPIPSSYWNPASQRGTLVQDAYNGKGLTVYMPFGYNNANQYDCFYMKLGTNNTSSQFFTYPGVTSHFEYVLDHMIMNGEMKPCIVIVIDGNKPNTGWLQYNALGLVQYVESKVSSYANKDVSIPSLVGSNMHRAIGGWSLGSIETRTMLVNDLKNDYYKLFNWYDIQSGYNSNGMNTISETPFVGVVCGSKDDGGCITFTSQCMKFFTSNPKLQRNLAQIVPGYTHMIKYQNNYFAQACKYFFGTDR